MSNEVTGAMSKSSIQWLLLTSARAALVEVESGSASKHRIHCRHQQVIYNELAFYANAACARISPPPGIPMNAEEVRPPPRSINGASVVEVAQAKQATAEAQPVGSSRGDARNSIWL